MTTRQWADSTNCQPDQTTADWLDCIRHIYLTSDNEFVFVSDFLYEFLFHIYDLPALEELFGILRVYED